MNAPLFSSHRWTQFLSALLALGVCVAGLAAGAAEPTIRAVDVRGLQIGGRTTITIDGADLSTSPRLLLPLPGAQAELKTGSTATKAVFDVTLGADVVPGVYQWRLATDEGVSGPIVVGVDRLPQRAVAPKIDSLPAAVHGVVAGSAVVETQFTAAAAGELWIEVESARLGAKLRPVVHLFDANRKQLAWAWPTRSLGGDTRLKARLPAAGDYTIQLHDAEYAAAAPSHFRLKVGDWHFADAAFPAAVQRGKKSTVSLVGRLPVATTIEVHPQSGQTTPAGWPRDAAASGPRVSLLVSDLPELVEPASTSAAVQPAASTLANPVASNPPPAATLPEISVLPAAMNGRLSAPGEQDAYHVSVAPGMKLKLELFGERLGAPIDPVLIVRNEQGVQLARGDDGAGTVDPTLEYTVPDKTTSIVLEISDLLGRGGESSIYRLTIMPQTTTSSQHDFRLFTLSDRFRVARGSSAVLPVIVERKGYDGPIRLTPEGLPAGVEAANLEIPAGAEGTLVTLSGVGAAGAIGTVRLRGASVDDKLVRDVMFEQHPTGDLQPWLRSELAVMLAAEQPFQVQWGALPDDTQLTFAGKLNLPLKLVRPAGDAGAVRLTLTTTQVVPKQGANPDPTKALRADKPIELAGDKTEGELPIVVPLDLPASAYDVAVVAELLGKDKKTVVATAVTPPRRLPTRNPLELMLATASLEPRIVPKQAITAVFSGKVERRGGFQGVVTITAVGLPTGVRAENAVVKADANDFELKIVFPATTKPGPIDGVRVVASSPPDAAKPTLLVKTKETPVTIQLVADAP